jgi:hypothetical protein
MYNLNHHESSSERRPVPKMRAVSKALLAVVLFWSVGALVRQPTPYLPNPELTPSDDNA